MASFVVASAPVLSEAVRRTLQRLTLRSFLLRPSLLVLLNRYYRCFVEQCPLGLLTKLHAAHGLLAVLQRHHLHARLMTKLAHLLVTSLYVQLVAMAELDL